MKIVYIHTAPFPSPMAGSVFALSTAIGLAKAGHDATLVVPSAGKSKEEAIAYYDMPIPENLTIKMLAPQRISIGPFGFTYTKRYYRDVKWFLENKAREADGIIVRTLKLAAYLSRFDFGVPLIYEMHNWYGDIDKKWAGAKWMIGKKKLRHEKALSVMEKQTMPKLAGAITLREATAEIVRDEYPDLPVKQISTGLDAPDELPEVSPGNTVVYLGQLHPHKGLDLLFEAAVYAKELSFLILGGGQWLDHWKKVAEEKEVSDRVTFAGHIPKAQVPKLLAKGRVGVLPMLDCFFNRYITSPLKILEYYAAGLPVVTADAPVTSELVAHEKTGLLVPFGDPRALAYSLSRLSFDEELHNTCRTNIKTLLPDLSWQTRGEKIAAFVRDLQD